MERLIELYNIASPSGKEKLMARYIMAELKKMGVACRKDRTGNIYAVKGNADTNPCWVQRKKPQTGIGADDKNGIWICFKMLERFKNMKCAFFVGEETGCVGSGRADMDFFNDCRFVIQCDRRGNRALVHG